MVLARWGVTRNSFEKYPRFLKDIVTAVLDFGNFSCSGVIPDFFH